MCSHIPSNMATSPSPINDKRSINLDKASSKNVKGNIGKDNSASWFGNFWGRIMTVMSPKKASFSVPSWMKDIKNFFFTTKVYGPLDQEAEKKGEGFFCDSGR